MGHQKKDPMKILDRIVREDQELLRKLNTGSKKVRV